MFELCRKTNQFLSSFLTDSANSAINTIAILLFVIYTAPCVTLVVLPFTETNACYYNNFFSYTELSFWIPTSDFFINYWIFSEYIGSFSIYWFLFNNWHWIVFKFTEFFHSSFHNAMLICPNPHNEIMLRNCCALDLSMCQYYVFIM